MAFARDGVMGTACLRASNTTKSLPRPCILRKGVMGPPYRGRTWLLPLPEGGKIRQAGMPSLGADMSLPSRLSFPSLFFLFSLGAHAVTAAETDPHVWLEDVHGQKPLAWV